MTVHYQSSEREQAARERLYKYNRDLREALLDLLSIVSASDDPIGASAELPWPEPERLRRRAEAIERRDAIIHRARRVIDGTKDAKDFTSKLPAPPQEPKP